MLYIYVLNTELENLIQCLGPPQMNYTRIFAIVFSNGVGFFTWKGKQWLQWGVFCAIHTLSDIQVNGIHAIENAFSPKTFFSLLIVVDLYIHTSIDAIFSHFMWL